MVHIACNNTCLVAHGFAKMIWGRPINTAPAIAVSKRTYVGNGAAAVRSPLSQKPPWLTSSGIQPSDRRVAMVS